MSQQQLERLAKYIRSEIEGEPSRQNEGIADCAIRLLKQLNERIAELEKQSEHWKLQYMGHAESLDFAKMRLEELEDAQRWIPFSERQPDDGEECLIETLCTLRGYDHTSVSYHKAYDSNVFVPGDWIKIRWAKVPPR